MKAEDKRLCQVCGTPFPPPAIFVPSVFYEEPSVMTRRRASSLQIRLLRRQICGSDIIRS